MKISVVKVSWEVLFSLRSSFFMSAFAAGFFAAGFFLGGFLSRRVSSSAGSSLQRVVFASAGFLLQRVFLSVTGFFACRLLRSLRVPFSACSADSFRPALLAASPSGLYRFSHASSARAVDVNGEESEYKETAQMRRERRAGNELLQWAGHARSRMRLEGELNRKTTVDPILLQ